MPFTFESMSPQQKEALAIVVGQFLGKKEEENQKTIKFALQQFTEKLRKLMEDSDEKTTKKAHLNAYEPITNANFQPLDVDAGKKDKKTVAQIEQDLAQKIEKITQKYAKKMQETVERQGVELANSLEKSGFKVTPEEAVKLQTDFMLISEEPVTRASDSELKMVRKLSEEYGISMMAARRQLNERKPQGEPSLAGQIFSNFLALDNIQFDCKKEQQAVADQANAELAKSPEMAAIKQKQEGSEFPPKVSFYRPAELKLRLGNSAKTLEEGEYGVPVSRATSLFATIYSGGSSIKFEIANSQIVFSVGNEQTQTMGHGS